METNSVQPKHPTGRRVLNALTIAPDRALADQFSSASAGLGAFSILVDFKSYPSEQTLDIRLRQLQPEVVILDVASNFATSLALLGLIAASSPDVKVLAIDHRCDSETILRVLRAGASEFLYAPFDSATTGEAIDRLERLRRPEPAVAAELGNLIAFTSVKPGAGASTLATQTAFALKRATGKRVLLADLDLMGGTIGFYLKLEDRLSTADALERAGQLTPGSWTSTVATFGGLDILPAPLAPHDGRLETDRLEAVLNFARTMYDWIIVDLPVVFQHTSLLTISQSDGAFLVVTPELPNLHLGRKAIAMLNDLGFPKDRLQIVVNRMNKRLRITRGDIEKLFKCSVHATIPNDYFSLHSVVLTGQPLGNDGELARAISNLAAEMAATRRAGACSA
jgi:pilus assembly protein CpaE